MITMVDVEVVSYKRVIIEVEHEEGESPTDLTDADRDNAIQTAEMGPPDYVNCERVRVVA